MYHACIYIYHSIVIHVQTCVVKTMARISGEKIFCSITDS